MIAEQQRQMWRIRLARRDDFVNDRFAIRVWANTEHHARGIAHNRHRDCTVLGRPQPCGRFQNELPILKEKFS